MAIADAALIVAKYLSDRRRRGIGDEEDEEEERDLRWLRNEDLMDASALMGGRWADARRSDMTR